MHWRLWLVSILLCFPVPASGQTGMVPVQRYNLTVSLDVPASLLTGNAAVTVGSGEKLSFEIGNLDIRNVTLDSRPADYTIRGGRLVVTANASGLLKIAYRGTYCNSPEYAGTSAPSDVIGSRGILLSGVWYPRTGRITEYRLKAVLPRGYHAVSAAEQVDRVEKDDRVEFVFRFDHPVEQLALIAGPDYEAVSDTTDGIELWGYFLPGHRNRAEAFLQQAKKLLAEYQTRLGHYPFRRFSIVENFQPSALDTSTLAIFGPDEVALPSAQGRLGRRLLSQWFGNSVYIDPNTGNWADGLTLYLEGRYAVNRADGGWESRKRMLLDYSFSSDPQGEISLREFRHDTGGAAGVAGQAKGAMVFHMLQRLIGDEAFNRGLRTFLADCAYRPASWSDLRAAFEKESHRSLDVFFRQWIDRKGLPVVTVTSASVKRNGDSFEAAVEVRQESGQPYLLELPAVLTDSGGSRSELLNLDADRKTFVFRSRREPRSITIDGNYDLARRLTPAESSPAVSELFSKSGFIIVPPVSRREAYAGVIPWLRERGGREVEASGLSDEAIRSSSLAVLGDDNPVADRLFGRIEAEKTGFSMLARENPWNENRVVVLIDSRGTSASDSALPKVPGFETFSSIAFEHGENVTREMAASERGIDVELRQTPAAIELSRVKKLDDVISAAEGSRIVYIGEQHDKYAHHAVQLEMIRSLYRKSRKFAIGMEMFQRPFQKVVDNYIAGRIDERAFLKQTEYFKRWVFDYNLYKPIVDFAVENRIPVVALNQKTEITEKVSRGGIDSLNDAERDQVPRQMDYSDAEYQGRLQSVFAQHQKTGGMSFDHFYQAQILWDETMALSVDEFMRKHPDYRMVVIAGGGHVAYGSGIPKRVFRRNRLPYFIALNDGTADADSADYLVLPEPLQGTDAPKLMAALKVENKRVTVTGFPDNSVSEKAGIKAGDVIQALDGHNVESIEDIRIILFYKKAGDVVTVRLLRKRFLLGDREMTVPVSL